MKDITSEMHEKILNNKEESNKRRTFTGATGKQFEMPENIFSDLINQQRYLEVINLKDIKDNWDEISIRKPLSLSILSFFASQTMKQIKEDPHLTEKIKEDTDLLQNNFDKVLENKQRKEKKSLINKLTGGKLDIPKTSYTSLYLTGVKLEKTDTFKYGTLEGARYIITDQYGNEIKAIHFRDSLAHTVFESHSANPRDVKEKLDMSRLDPRPFVVVCYPFDTTEPMLQIMKVQSGGKTIDPLIPTIPGN